VTRSTNLDGDRGAKPSALPTSRKGRAERARRHAADLAPVIAELRAAGVTTLRGIAAELNARGIPTATGKGHAGHAAECVRCLGLSYNSLTQPNETRHLVPEYLVFSLQLRHLLWYVTHVA
jgi:hypothetical protein